MQKNDLIGKTKLILKFMTSQPGSQTIAIHILINISRSKGNKFNRILNQAANHLFLRHIKLL